MSKIEALDWRAIAGFFVLVGLIAGVARLGATSWALSADLQEVKCEASYWKGRALGHASNYCPDGCKCELWALR